jgi:hypothetical protein
VNRVRCEEWFVVEREAAAQVRCVFGGDHGSDTSLGRSCGGIDPDDATGRDRGEHQGGIERSGELEVHTVNCLAAHLRLGIETGHALPDGAAHERSSVAVRTASMIVE